MLYIVGHKYTLIHRQPSSPGIPIGISLLDEDSQFHCGWVKNADRRPVDAHLEAGRSVEGAVESLGRRWRQWDPRLGLKREWRLGVLAWRCVNLGSPGTQSTTLVGGDGEVK